MKVLQVYDTPAVYCWYIHLYHPEVGWQQLSSITALPTKQNKVVDLVVGGHQVNVGF